MSGNVWMFSDQIDDEDLEFMTHEFVTYSMACDYYRLGLKPVTRIQFMQSFSYGSASIITPFGIIPLVDIIFVLLSCDFILCAIYARISPARKWKPN